MNEFHSSSGETGQPLTKISAATAVAAAGPPCVDAGDREPVVLDQRGVGLCTPCYGTTNSWVKLESATACQTYEHGSAPEHRKSLQPKRSRLPFRARAKTHRRPTTETQPQACTGRSLEKFSAAAASEVERRGGAGRSGTDNVAPTACPEGNSQRTKGRKVARKTTTPRSRAEKSDSPGTGTQSQVGAGPAVCGFGESVDVETAVAVGRVVLCLLFERV